MSSPAAPLFICPARHQRRSLCRSAAELARSARRTPISDIAGETARRHCSSRCGGMGWLVWLSSGFMAGFVSTGRGFAPGWAESYEFHTGMGG